MVCLSYRSDFEVARNCCVPQSLYPVEWRKLGLTSSDAIWSFVPGWRNLLHLLAIFAVGPWFDGSLGTSLSSGQS
jgi:hypothetical protein